MRVLGSNISSLNTVRHLNESTSSLQDNFRRLSSGLRINSAKDDPAGLAMADSLQMDRRVYTQGIRNINDGISHLNIMEAAASELKNILFRMSELASQAANGTITSTQRQALDKESNSLISEYSRIMRTSEFNGKNVFSEEAALLEIQTSYGEVGLIKLTTQGIGITGGGEPPPSGDGTFGAQTTYAVGSSPQAVAIGDFNGDGISDIVSANYYAGSISTILGNGDGTFGTNTDYSAGGSVHSVAIGDFNGDGVQDVVATNLNEHTISVFIGNGDGTFGARTTYATGTFPRFTAIGDFNRDGILDIVSANDGSDNVGVFLGNGDGTFGAQTTFAVGDAPMMVSTADFNGDGILDLVTLNSSSNNLSVLLGNGNGTFGAQTTYATGTYPTSISIGDFNGDGVLDLVSANSSSNNLSVLLGNGNGTFGAQTTYDAGNYPSAVSAGDFNGDGILDLAATNLNAGTVSVLLGNGNGSFGARTTYAAGSAVAAIAIGDFNGDGISDLVAANMGSDNLGVFLGNAASVEGAPPGGYLTLQAIQGVSLLTQTSAMNSVSVIEGHIEDVGKVLGYTGAGLSRLETAARKQMLETENLAAAESRIRDLDVAIEAAALAKNQIRQQAAVSVLGLSNQQPAIVLDLLAWNKK